jgi:hypothetical protein
MQEVWKCIEGYEGKYEVSNLGRVKSLIDRNGNFREVLVKPRMGKQGYLYVHLWKKSQQNTKKIHRLVAETFLTRPKDAQCVNHKNCVKTDNRVDNLEWCTFSYNTKHAINHGRCREQSGEKNHMYGRTYENSPFARPIFQCNKEGKVIKEWSCVKRASEELKISHIDACARGVRKTAGGYIWKYKEV